MSFSQVIVRATFVIALINLLSKVLGFIRDMVIAHQFGATGETDAYLVAYTIPYILMNILALALATVVVPVFSEYQSKGRRQEAWNLFNKITTITIIIFFVLAVCGMAFASVLVKLIAPGLSGETALLAEELTLIMMPALVFMGVSTLFNGLLNANNIFAVPALTVVVANTIVIISTLTLGKIVGIYGVAIGTLLSLIVAAIMQVPYLYKVGFRYKFDINFRDSGVQKVMSMMIPVVVGVSVNQLYIIIDRILASGLAEGSISALNFANKLILLPLGLFVMAIGTAFYPTLTRQVANSSLKSAKDTLQKSFKMVLLFTVPASVGLFVLRYPIIQLLFERGAFDARATDMTATALMFFSIGLAAQSVNVILTRGFYALHDTRTPVKLTFIAVFINLILSLSLIGPLQHGGLALATSIAAIINTLMLSKFLSKRMQGLWDKSVLYFCLKIGIASMLMGIVVFYVDGFINLSAYGDAGLLVETTLCIFVGALIYIFMGFLLKVQEIFWLYELTKNHVKKYFL